MTFRGKRQSRKPLPRLAQLCSRSLSVLFAGAVVAACWSTEGFSDEDVPEKYRPSSVLVDGGLGRDTGPDAMLDPCEECLNRVWREDPDQCVNGEREFCRSLPACRSVVDCGFDLGCLGTPIDQTIQCILPCVTPAGIVGSDDPAVVAGFAFAGCLNTVCQSVCPELL